MVKKFLRTLDAKDPLFIELTEYARFLPITAEGAKVPRMYDVSSITENPKLFKKIIDFLTERFRRKKKPPTHILAVESRGFVLGAPLALQLGIPLVLLRTSNTTPTSFDDFDMVRSKAPSIVVRNRSIDSNSNVVIIDDIISTGITMRAAIDCVNIVGAHIQEIVAVCDMIEGGGMEAINEVRENCDFTVFTFFRLRNSLEAISHHSKKKWISHL